MFDNITALEFQRGLEADNEIVLIDVRTPGEVAQGKIEGAIEMDIMSPDFPQKALALDKSKKYYIYCRSGNRSGQACGFMAQNGFDHCTNLMGGVMDWKGPLV